MSFLKKQTNRKSSRRQIQIKEVRDGILILPNRQYRLLIETSSVNFELKSEAEQDVMLDSFQNFLNSLVSPIQILVRVREIDIDSYLTQLALSKTTEKEKIYKTQIDNYCSFIKNLVSGNKILSRRFYIIIPYKGKNKTDDFTSVSEHINLQRSIVSRGLEKLGMKAKPLESLELLDLFYSFYNSGQVKTQELKGHTIEALITNSYA
mgnify:CR=1 FL=1